MLFPCLRLSSADDPTPAEGDLLARLAGSGRLTRQALARCFSLQDQRVGSSGAPLATVLVELGIATAEDVRASEGVAPAAEAGPPRIERYWLGAEVGRGGMGIVYRAFDPVLCRQVAMKLMARHRVDSPQSRARFEREASAVARLDHPGIVKLHAVGEHEGRPYVVMDFVEGASLERCLARGPMAHGELARIVHDVALALEHAHRQGILHRDVKPENILVDVAGKAHITDFGLALGDDSKPLTVTGQLLGTPRYMAPEQALGERGVMTPRVDVYGLGGLLYRGLSERPPNKGGETFLDVLRSLRDEPVAPLSEVAPGAPLELANVAMKCLEKDPGRRYGSALEVAEALARSSAPADVGPGEPRAWSPLRAGAVAVLVLVAASLGVGLGRGSGVPTAESHVAAASAALARSDHRGAFAEAARAIDLDPSCSEGWTLRAQSRLGLGDLDGAVIDAERAIALDRSGALPWAVRAAARLAKREFMGAIADASTSIELDRGCFLAWSARQEARLRIGAFTDSLQDGERALALSPRSAAVHAHRGEAFLALGDAGAALGAFGRALETAPDDAGALLGRGMARARCAEDSLALEDLSRAIGRAPELSLAWLERAHERRKLGAVESAADDYRHFLEIDPRSPRAAEARAALRELEGR
jgi:tetratricopeptide (TPR) repeat protein/tRNA A-37 threonylcarbamoyl transferase component Bud32